MAIVESSDDIIASKDLDGVITSWNKGAERILGYTAEEVIGSPSRCSCRPRSWRTRSGSSAASAAARRWTTTRRGGGGRTAPIIDVSLTVSPIRNAEGEIVGASKVGRDITDQRRAQELNERLAAIVESSDDIIASKDLDGVITSWNRGAERILGYTAEEVIGQHVSMIMPPELVEDMPRILEKIRRGEKVDHYQTRRRRKDGTIIDVSLTVSPIRDAAGRDHRGLEDRPGHHRREAGPRGTRAAPGGRPEGQGRRRGRQPHEGRVPRHPLARAADPAQRHPRLGQDPEHRPGRTRRT